MNQTITTMKQTTTFIITKKPGPMALLVETSSFRIVKSGTGWVAQREVPYRDSIVNVFIVFMGNLGQPFEMTMTINNVKETIKESLYTSGRNEFRYSYAWTKFVPGSAPLIAGTV